MSREFEICERINEIDKQIVELQIERNILATELKYLVPNLKNDEDLKEVKVRKK